MPTTYAHDAFGRKLYRQLPEEIQETIHRHIQLYRIGLHGPDILFYYGLSKNHVNQTGVRLHGEPALSFFQNGLTLARQDQDEALLAYLLGFACHFMLDSTCHPYIYQIKNEISHTLIEKEFDRRLMERDGRDPLTYFPARGIIPSRENARTIAKMFPTVTEHEVKESLRKMRRSTGFMVYGNGRRRKVILMLLGLIGQRKSFEDYFMTRVCEFPCEEQLEVLEGLFEQAMRESTVILEALYSCSQEEGSVLPERFHRNYK